MEAQTKVLADLMAAISSMNAKLDAMHPVILELNQGRPGVVRAVDALQAEVGDLQAGIIDATRPAEPAVSTILSSPLFLSADTPSSSSKPASPSEQTSAAAATACIDYLDTSHAVPVDAKPSTLPELMAALTLAAATTSCIDACTCASPFDTNGRDAEVSAQVCSSPDQDAFSPSMGVTTVEMLREGVSESVPMSATPLGSSASASISKETLEVDPSACTGFIATTPTTCSPDCLPQQPMAATVLVGPSSLILTRYGLDTMPTTTFVARESLARSSSNTGTSDSTPPFTRGDAPEMLDPMSELFDKSVDAVTWRPPRRPPELEAASDQNCAREPLPSPWPSLACDTEPVQCSPSEDRAPLSNWPMLNGTRSTSYGYIIGIVLRSPSGILCLDEVLLFLEYWGSASDCVQSAHTNHTTLVWLPCSTIPGLHLLVMVSNVELQLSSHGSAPFTSLKILLDSGEFAALSESVAGLLSTMDWHLWDFPYRSAVTVCSYWSGYSIAEMISIWPILSSQVVQGISTKSLICEPYEKYCCFAIVTLDLHNSISLSDSGSPSDANVVLLSFCGKTHQIRFLCQGGSHDNLPSRVSCKFLLRNHQDTGQMQIVRSARVHAFVLPVGKRCLSWLFSHAAIGRGALLILTQSDVLKCMDLWWCKTAILTEAFKAWFSWQMSVACSANRICCRLLHIYQLTCDPDEGSCPGVLISLNLHSTISFADSNSLGWVAHQAVFCKTGTELPLHFYWTSWTAIEQSDYEAVYNKQVWELAMDIWDPGDVLVHLVIRASGPCVTACLADGTTDKIASSHEIVISKDLHAPRDPSGHTP